MLVGSTKIVLGSRQAPRGLAQAVLGSCKAAVGHCDGLLRAGEHRPRWERDRVEREIVKRVARSDAGGVIRINVLVPWKQRFKKNLQHYFWQGLLVF